MAVKTRWLIEIALTYLFRRPHPFQKKSKIIIFLKIAQGGGGQTWDLFVFVKVLSKSSALAHSAAAPPSN